MKAPIHLLLIAAIYKRVDLLFLKAYHLPCMMTVCKFSFNVAILTALFFLAAYLFALVGLLFGLLCLVLQIIRSD